MTDLVIERMHATYDGVDVEGAERLDGALGTVATSALAEQLLGRPIDTAFAICLDRVDVVLDLDPRRPVVDLARQWAEALADALAAGLSRAVVFRREEDALDALVAAVAGLSTDHLWALGQIGLVARHHPAACSDDLVLALERRPELVPGVIARWAPRPFPLDARGWTAVAAAFDAWSPRRRVADRRRSAGSSDPHRTPEDDRAVEGPSGSDALAPPVPPGTIGHLVEVVGRDAWTRIDQEGRTDVVALVLAALAPQLTPTSITLDALLGAIDERRRTGGSAGPAAPTATATAASTARTVPTPAPAPSGPLTELSEDPPSPTAVTVSDHAGVCFLIHALADLEVAERVPHPLLDPTAMPAHLARIVAEATGVDVTDPAVRAIAGWPDHEPTPFLHRELGPMGGALVEAVAAEVHDWLRLRLDTDEFGWVWPRRAVIDAEPGWLEVAYDLAQVDVAVRRAGLDLDPGFVWWLGAVVRFRYV